MPYIPKISRRPLPEAVPALHASPLLSRLYAARGLQSPEEADLALAHLLPPDGLRGLDTAVDLLLDAIGNDRRIVVVGDFDCDGATGAALAVRGLSMLGARQVGFKVPHRILHGYGLTPGLVEELIPSSPDLVVTVDSGIACLPGVARAKALGWKVLVTDHHLPGERLPDADAIVNPNQPGCPFASKALAGVGVMFYLLLAVRRRLRERGLPAMDADLSSLLDLVAIGTVAHQQDEARHGCALAAIGRQKIGPPAHDGRRSRRRLFDQALRLLRPRARRARMMLRPPGVAMRAR